jgi:hypothetical protein
MCSNRCLGMLTTLTLFLQVLQQLREERSRLQAQITPPQSPVCCIARASPTRAHAFAAQHARHRARDQQGCVEAHLSSRIFAGRQVHMSIVLLKMTSYSTGSGHFVCDIAAASEAALIRLFVLAKSIFRNSSSYALRNSSGMPGCVLRHGTTRLA